MGLLFLVIILGGTFIFALVVAFKQAKRDEQAWEKRMSLIERG